MEEETKKTENNRSKNLTVLWVFLAFILGFILPVGSCLGTGFLAVVTLTQFSTQDRTTYSGSRDAIGVIDLNGTITSDTAGVMSAQGTITPGQVTELLDKANYAANIKAVVVRINSPGGSVVASDEIYHMLLDFDKPVVIWLGDTAASGGFYISCGGDYVIAHPDSLTGSIGVISQFINAEDLLDELGVKVMVLTTGAHKDMGSLFREMTEEEQEIWTGILDQVYGDFVKVVAESRILSEDKVRDLADGRVYTGRQAYELDLVDKVGLYTDAIDKAVDLGGITGDYDVIQLEYTPTFIESLMNLQMRSTTWEQVMAWAGAPSLEFRFTGP